MPFKDKNIKKIAHLARLQIDEADLPEYASNLSNILELVNQISIIDTQEISPTEHPLGEASQRLRHDIVSEHVNREDFQSIAPLTEAGLYLVPKVIDE